MCWNANFVVKKKGSIYQIQPKIRTFQKKKKKPKIRTSGIKARRKECRVKRATINNCQRPWSINWWFVFKNNTQLSTGKTCWYWDYFLLLFNSFEVSSWFIELCKVFMLAIVCLDTVYCWKLKIENWKYCNKIIFKYVNSIVRPGFKIVFTKKSNCGSHEQCTRPTYQNANVQFIPFQQHPNGY